MKILLVNALARNYREFNAEDGLPNIGLLYIGAALKSSGNTIRYTTVTQYSSNSEFSKIVADFQPEVVGFSLCSSAVNISIKMALLAREMGCHVIAGGPHINLSANNKYEKFRPFNAVFCGESEETVVRYVDSLPTDNNQFYGIFRSPVSHNLDAFPLLDISDWFKDFHSKLPSNPSIRSIQTQLPMMPILASRGCPGTCTYCGNYIKSLRFRNIESIISEIKQRILHHHPKTFLFFDDTFTYNNKYIQKLCNAISANDINIRFTCLTRPDCVSDSTVKALKEAGCDAVTMGIESFDSGLLKRLGRNISADVSYRSTKLLKQFNLSVKVNFIVGIPGETEKHYAYIEDFLDRFKLNFFNIYVLRPHPGTPFYRSAIRKGLILDPNGYKRAYLNGEITETKIQIKRSREIFKSVDYDALFEWRKKMLDKYRPADPGWGQR